VDTLPERDLLPVHRIRQGQLPGRQLPDPFSLRVVGGPELADAGDAPVHGLVQVEGPVGRQHDDALVALHFGQEGVEQTVAPPLALRKDYMCVSIHFDRGLGYF
jgi:hypothetical protein